MSQHNHTSIQHIVDDHQKQNKSQIHSMSSSPSKESEPSRQQPEYQITEVGELSEKEPQIKDKEVANFVRVEKHLPTLDPRLKKAGLSTIDHVSLDPRQRMHLPISDEKIMQGLDQPIHSSWRWFSVFLIALLHHAHITLKKVHGHVVRILVR